MKKNKKETGNGERGKGASAVYSRPAPRSAPIPSPRQPWGNRHGNNSHLGALVNMKVGAEEKERLAFKWNGCGLCVSQQVEGKKRVPNRKRRGVSIHQPSVIRGPAFLRQHPLWTSHTGRL